MKRSNYITVIGVDNKKHIAKPHEKVCKCGVKVKRKKLRPSDHNLFGCYECTY